MQPADSAPFPPLHRRLLVALMAWFAMLGIDFLLNGAVFAKMYQGGGPFFIAPSEAFRRIPIGYLAFLILAVGVVEVAHHLRLRGYASGLRLGLAMGGSLAAVWSLSLFSIASVPAEAALVFAAIWLVLVCTASVVATTGLGRASVRKLGFGIFLLDTVCVASVIALQSSGVVSTASP